LYGDTLVLSEFFKPARNLQNAEPGISESQPYMLPGMMGSTSSYMSGRS